MLDLGHHLVYRSVEFVQLSQENSLRFIKLIQFNEVSNNINMLHRQLEPNINSNNYLCKLCMCPSDMHHACPNWYLVNSDDVILHTSSSGAANYHAAHCISF